MGDGGRNRDLEPVSIYIAKYFIYFLFDNDNDNDNATVFFIYLATFDAST